MSSLSVKEADMRYRQAEVGRDSLSPCRRVDDGDGRDVTTNDVMARRLNVNTGSTRPRVRLGMGRQFAGHFMVCSWYLVPPANVGKRAGRYVSQIPDLGVTDAPESIPTAMSGSAH